MNDATRFPDASPLDDEREQALTRAESFGVDLSLIRETLRLTPAERLARHQHALDLVLALRSARTTAQP